MVKIIAELGSGHLGDFNRAIAMIHEAAVCGASGVKMQLFRADSLDSRPEVQERLRRFELPIEWLKGLRDCAHERGLRFIVTPFAIDLVEPLRGVVDAIKISAYDLTYRGLIEAAANLGELGVAVILSTAMGNRREIHQAWDWAWKAGGRDITILHGVAAYPAKGEDMNLREMVALKREFSQVGLSDHTIGYEAAVIAVAQGGTCIEKHFRLDEVGEESPDYGVSATPAEFAEMVRQIRRTEKALGNGKKEGPLECEMELYRTCRRSNGKPLRG